MSFRAELFVLLIVGLAFSCDVKEPIGTDVPSVSDAGPTPLVPATSVVGTLNGAALELTDSISVNTYQQGALTGRTIVLTNKTGACQTESAGLIAKEQTRIFLFLFRNRSNSYSSGSVGLAPDAGKYSFENAVSETGESRWVFAVIEKTDANCQNTLSSNSTLLRSGYVNVTEISDGSGGIIKGNFDLTFGDQKDRLTGTFESPLCDVDLSKLTKSCESSNRVNGTLDGISLDLKHSFYTNTYSGEEIIGRTVRITDQPNLCVDAKAGRTPKESTVIFFGFLRSGRLTPTSSVTWLPPDVGEYLVRNAGTQSEGRGVLVCIQKSDKICSDTLSSNRACATSGVVKLTSVGDKPWDRLNGTFDLSFGAQKDRITGTFSASACDVDWTVNRSCE